MIVLEEEASGRRLGHEAGTLRNGITVCIKGTPESSFTLFLPSEGTVRRQLQHNLQRGPSASCIIKKANEKRAFVCFPKD